MSKCPMIIEFYGLPGSGKSTISHMLAIQLRKQGEKVHEPSYYLDNEKSAIVRKILKIICALAFIFIAPKIFCRILQIIKKYFVFKFYNIVNNYINLSYKIMMYKISNADYLIFDEGVFQAVISIDVKKNKDRYKMIDELLLLIHNNITPIYVDVSIETSIKRMMNRLRHDSRVEKISDDQERIDYLIYKKQILDKIENNRIMVESMCDVDTVVDQIIRVLKTR